MITKTLYVLVEDDGDVEAASLLLRRLLDESFVKLKYEYAHEYEIAHPYSAAGRDNLTNPASFQNLLNVIRQQPDCSGLLVLLETGKDFINYPSAIANRLANIAKKLTLPFPTAVICLACEYELWFLYNLDRIAPIYQLTTSTYDQNPDRECSAKAWLDQHMPVGRHYNETIDQVKMTALIDIERTHYLSLPFRRLVYHMTELLKVIEGGRT